MVKLLNKTVWTFSSMLLFLSLVLVSLVASRNVDSFLESCRKSVKDIFDNSYDSEILQLKNGSGWSCLHMASYHGTLDVVKYLVNDKKVDILDRNHRNETALHLACSGGHLEIVEFLLADDQNNKAHLLEAEQVDGQTPIFYAISSKNVAIISHLVDVEVNLNHADWQGMKPVHFAVTSRAAEVFTVLAMRAEPGRCTCSGADKTVSHLAAEYDFAEFIDTEGNFAADDTDYLGQTPACWAAINGSVKFANKMIEKGFSISLGSCRYGISGDIIGTPLHAAAFYQQKSYIELLLNKGANVTAKDTLGGTPAHALALGGNLGVSMPGNAKRIAELFSEKVAIDTRDNAERTPFLVAVSSSSLEAADAFYHLGVDINAMDSQGYFAIHLVGSIGLRNFVLDLPADRRIYDVNSGTHNPAIQTGFTPLLAITKLKREIPVIRALWNHPKVNRTAVNDDGQNALHIAVEQNYSKAVELFIKPDFDKLVTMQDKQGRTPLHYATELGFTDIALQLITCQRCKSVLKNQLPKTLDTPLHVAVTTNNSEIAENLLLADGGVDLLSVVNAKKETALHKAVAYRDPKMVQLLLSRIHGGSSAVLHQLKAADSYGRTPFHLAALRCDDEGLQIVKIIEQAINSTNITQLMELVDNYQQTALDIALKQNCPKMVSMLIAMYRTYGDTSKSGSCAKRNKQGYTPWQLAATLNYEPLAEMLKANQCYSPDDERGLLNQPLPSYDPKNENCLRCCHPPAIPNGAIANGPSCVGTKRSITCHSNHRLAGSGFVECNSESKWEVHGHCAENKCPDLPIILNGVVSNGDSNVDAKRTIACNTNYRVAGSGLIECNSDAKWVIRGYCEMSSGSEMNCGEVPGVRGGVISPGSSTIGTVRQLKCNSNWVLAGSSHVICSSDAKWNVVGSCNGAKYIGQTWFNAVINGEFEKVKSFIDHGADVNAKNKQDEADYLPTALHYSAQHGHAELAELLLNNSARIDEKDKHGLTPLMETCNYGTKEVFEVLLKHNADINAKNNDDWTPLSSAAYHCRYDLVVVLVQSPQLTTLNHRNKENKTALQYAIDKIDPGNRDESEYNEACEKIEQLLRSKDART